jgi:predicted DNA-binding antitoxin AbrB/MazE fold protein
MPITVEAVYENGVLKPAQPLGLQEHERVQLTVQTSADLQAAHVPGSRGYGLVQWTGSVADLDFLIEDADNDPLEGP